MRLLAVLVWGAVARYELRHKYDVAQFATSSDYHFPQQRRRAELQL